MQNLMFKELENAINQIEKYNIDFKYRFLNLKTLFYEVEVLNKGLKKAANVNFSKNPNAKSLQKLQKALKGASLINNNFVAKLEQEHSDLAKISEYLIQKQPEFKQINTMMLSNDKDMQEAFDKLGAIKAVTHIKKINNNISICKNYTLPKLKSLLQNSLSLKAKLDAQVVALQEASDKVESMHA